MIKHYLTKLYLTLFLIFTFSSSSFLYAQSQNWKVLREKGANYFQIRDSFERQNATLLNLFRQNPSFSEGDSNGRFNNIIKFNRWSHFVAPRVAESRGDLSIIASGTANALNQRIATPENVGELWRSINPSTIPNAGGSGRINAIRVHPTNREIMFACSPSGGLWKTVNNGAQWFPIGESIAILGCSDVAFSAQNPNVMYLATGDGDGADSYSTGVYKSIDGGLTWQATGLAFGVGQSILLSRILINPNNGDILVSGSNGIYRSMDEGLNWTRVSTQNTRDMEFKPNDPNIVYATTYRPESGVSIFLRSNNGGLTWGNINNIAFTSNCVRGAIAVTEANPNYVYLLIADSANYGFKGLYRSTDAGLTFSTRATLSTTYNLLGWNSIMMNDVNGQGWYDLALAVSPTNSEELYLGGINISKSTDGGLVFSAESHWTGNNNIPILHADIHDIIYKGDEIWVATDGGVSSRNFRQLYWIDRSANLSVAQIYAMGVSKTNPNLIISGHQDNGTNLMSSRTNWRQVLGGDGLQCLISQTSNDTMLASLYSGLLHRSTNGGQSFFATSVVPSASWYTPFIQDPQASNTLYAGSSNVYKSVDMGDSWQVISNFGSLGSVSAIDIAKSNNQIIVAAKGTYVSSNRSVTTQIFKTINGGNTWTELVSPNFPTNASLIGLHIDVNNPNRIFVGFASYTGNSVYISTDGGTTWANYTTGLPQIPANCFMTIAGDTLGTVFVGTDIGVYRRKNNTLWENFSLNLPNVVISDLEIFYPTKKLRCATFGRGIWETSLPNYNSEPFVSIVSPIEGGIVDNSSINISANAIDSDGNIEKVEFYVDGTLLNTDFSAPYSYTWSNVSLGQHRVLAKAYDDSLTIGISDSVTFWAAKNRDLAIVSYIDTATLSLVDTPIINVVLQNRGLDTIRNAQISYRINGGVIQTQVWSGLLSPLSSVIITLSNRLRLVEGANTIITWSSMPNNLIDENTTNDTLYFTTQYSVNGVCRNSFEPNESYLTATQIPTDIKIQSMIPTESDLDFYRFTIDSTRPHFTFALYRMSSSAAVNIYRYNESSRELMQIESLYPNLITDTLYFDASRYGVGTYYLKFTSLTPSDTACYAFKIKTYGINHYQAAIDGIFMPSPVVYSATFVPRIRYKNKGNVPINSIRTSFRIDNSNYFFGSVNLPTPLLPNDTVTVSIHNALVPTYSAGNHTLTISPSSVNNISDENIDFDTIINFRYVAPPSVSLTLPTNEALFAAPTTTSLSATATASTGATVTRVEFYNGNTLLNTDNVAPYTFSWANIPAGRYILTAKVFDSQGLDKTSNPITLHVIASGLDAGMTSIYNASSLIAVDSFKPVIKIRNYGTVALTSVLVSYQLDNEPIISQQFNNINVASRAFLDNLSLPMLRYNRGRHNLKVWTSMPNNSVDIGIFNDTLVSTFDAVGFGYCGDTFEPSTLSSPTYIPLNTLVQSKFSNINDYDYYYFSLPRTHNARVKLFNLSQNNASIVFYKRNASGSAIELGSIYSSQIVDSLIYNYTAETGIDSSSYIIRVAGSLPQDNCYSLIVENLYQDIAIDSVLYPVYIVDSSSFFPIVRIKNIGTMPISMFNISTLLDNETMTRSYCETRFSTPLLPNDTITIRGNNQCNSGNGYVYSISTGDHQLSIRTMLSNASSDGTPENNTKLIPIRYNPRPIVYLIPLEMTRFANNSTIRLTAYASVFSGSTLNRIEIYANNILIGTGTTETYVLNWSNVATGHYRIQAKVYDNYNVMGVSEIIEIDVLDILDAKLATINEPYFVMGRDTLTPSVFVKNEGTLPINSFVLNFSLDNNTTVSRTFNNLNLTPNALYLANMPTIRYNLGVHTIRFWITDASNNGNFTDTVLSNNSLTRTFTYSVFDTCANNFEPNNTYATATAIPLNSVVKSQIGGSDEDVFVFSTGIDRESFTITVDSYAYNLPPTITLYKQIENSMSYQGAHYYYQSGTKSIAIEASDTAMYFLVVQPSLLDTTNTCYRVRVNAYQRPICHIVIDSLYPQGDVESINTITAKVRNLGNRTITSAYLRSRVDNFPYNSNLSTARSPIAPNDTGYFDMTNFYRYNIGEHVLWARFTSTNSFEYNINTTIDTQRFRIIAPPSVSITSPLQNTVFAVGSSVAINANATVNTNFSITKVEFYANGVLINTDYTAPYSYTWTNASIGVYNITAKVYDTQNVNRTSSPVSISVSGSNDAGIANIVNPQPLVLQDSIVPSVQVRNYGTSSITSINIHYQLDNNPIISQTFTGINIASGTLSTFNMNLERGLSEGWHSFKVWTNMPNNFVDTLLSNDTLSRTFEYRGWEYCIERLEGNTETHAQIPVNKTIRSKISRAGDYDLYKFSTKTGGERFVLSLLPDSRPVTVEVYVNYPGFGDYLIGQLNASNSFEYVSLDSMEYKIKVSGTPSNDCYAFMVRLLPKKVYDVKVDSIISPRFDVFSNRFNGVFKIINKGEVPIFEATFKTYVLDTALTYVTDFSARTNLLQNIAPNDTALFTIDFNTLRIVRNAYNTVYLVHQPFRNAYRDTTPDNDTVVMRLRYVVPPSVAWNTNNVDTIINANSPYTLSVNASACIDNTVARVEFYNNNTLVGIDSTAPFALTIPNLAANIYKFKAKVIDNQNLIDSTVILNVISTSGFDVEMQSIIDPTPLVGIDSIIPRVRIRNLSTQTLNSLRLYYQLDNGSINNYLFNNLSTLSGSTTSLELPFIRYSLGQHTLKVWSASPNSTIDSRIMNDTTFTNFRYEDFSICSNSFEPNNTISTATPIFTNILTRSVIHNGDEDFYSFTTTPNRTQFTVKLFDLPEDYDLYLFKLENNTYGQIASSVYSGTQQDSIIYMGTDTGSFIVKVVGYSQRYSPLCYSLKVETQFTALYDIAVDSILIPSPVMNTTYFMPRIRVKNKGNVNISNFKLNNATVNLITPLRPNDTITVNGTAVFNPNLNRLTTYNVRLSLPNGFIDINSPNDTMSALYRVIIPPSVSLNEINNRTLFVLGESVRLLANTTASIYDTITRVEFLANGTIVGTSNIRPYTLDLTNLPVGSHVLKAKLYDTQNLVIESNPLNINIINAGNIGVRISELIRPLTVVNEDSLRPVVVVRNISQANLNSLNIHYQLDGSAIVSQSFTGLNSSNNSLDTFRLPMMRHGRGTHLFRIWTSNINGSAQGINDTITMNFNNAGMSYCNNSFEPNNTVPDATPVGIDMIVRSKITNATDIDYYRFSTPINQTRFKVKLKDSGVGAYRLQLYRYMINTNGLSYMAQTSGLDSIEYSGLDTATYFLKVERILNSITDSCYTFQLSADVRNDLAIDSIISPSSLLFGRSFYPSIRVKNKGNTPISAFTWGVDINRMSWRGNPLLPNDTLTLTMSNFSIASLGVNTSEFTIRLLDSVDINTSNDTVRHTFVAVEPPFFFVNTLSNQTLYNVGQSVDIQTTTYVSAPDSIKKIEFYRDSILLGVDSTRPFSFSWRNPIVGTHNIKAKGYSRYDLSDWARNSIPITVIDTLDVEMRSVILPSSIVAVDSFNPMCKVRNLGNTAIRNLQIQYQLDNEPIQTASLPQLYIMTNSIESIKLSNVVRYTEGEHVFRIWLRYPNNIQGGNTLNDTLVQIFRYINPTICGNNFEPNNTIQMAQYIPTDTTIRATLSNGDTDYYIFNTTSAKPALFISLDSLPDGLVTLIELDNTEYNSFEGRLKFDRYTNGRTYYMRVTGNTASSGCYNLKIKTIDLADISVDSLLYPKGYIYTPVVQPRVKVSNQGTIAIDSCTMMLSTSNGWNTSINYRFNPPLAPGEVRVLNINENVSAYTLGIPTLLDIALYRPNNYEDRNPTNNGNGEYFTYVIPISVTTIVPRTNYLQGETVNITAQVSGGNNISRVEFYRGNVLLGTDNSTPFLFNWLNPLVGTHQIQSKAYDSQGNAVISDPVTINVQAVNDAGITAVLNPINLITVDTIPVRVRLRNFSQGFTLNAAKVKYRLNNSQIDSINWVGTLQPDSSVVVSLPTVRTTQLGLNILKIWLDAANDFNRANDSITYSFSYKLCGDNYEPNDTLNTAYNISTDRTYYAIINAMLDKDFYRFSTTLQKPNIMVTLNHDLQDCDLSLYRLELDNSLALLTNNNTRIQGLERIIWNSSVASNYVLVVRNQIRNINIDSCYNIRVEASDTNFVTKSMELISSSGFIMYPNPNHDVLTIVLSNEQEQNMIIDISDSFGRKILHQEVENNIVNLSTSNWAKGIYFVTLRQKSRIFTQKLIVD